MADSPTNEPNHENKRVIEFDMFVRDLDPKPDDNVRGGHRTGATKSHTESKEHSK